MTLPKVLLGHADPVLSRNATLGSSVSSTLSSKHRRRPQDDLQSPSVPSLHVPKHLRYHSQREHTVHPKR